MPADDKQGLGHKRLRKHPASPDFHQQLAGQWPALYGPAKFGAGSGAQPSGPGRARRWRLVGGHWPAAFSPPARRGQRQGSPQGGGLPHQRGQRQGRSVTRRRHFLCPSFALKPPCRRPCPRLVPHRRSAGGSRVPGRLPPLHKETRRGEKGQRAARLTPARS